MSSAFERLDALLGFWLDTEGRLTISYDKLKAEMKEHDCEVGFDVTLWCQALSVEPLLENISALLGDRLFIDTFFPGVDEEYLKTVALDTDNPKLASLFLDDVQNIFNRACIDGRKRIVKLLLEDGRADPAVEGSRPIALASFHGHYEIVKLLLEDGRADPTVWDNDAIALASWNGYYEVVKLLLEDGRADPTCGDNYVIRLASYNGHDTIVELLLEDGRAKLP